MDQTPRTNGTHGSHLSIVPQISIINPRIEQQLKSRGFKTTDKIIITDNKQDRVKYVKVYTVRGETSLVELDVSDFVTIDQTSDRLFYPTNEARNIPYSAKSGIISCTDNNSCHIAFECNNDMCVLQQSNNNLDSTETTFRTSNRPITDSGSTNVISYPIVKMSDIIDHPDDVFVKISEITNNIININIDQCRQTTEDLEKSLQRLVFTYSSMSSRLNLIFGQLVATINQLQQYQQSYLNRELTSPIERETYAKINFNLKKRHDMLTELFSLCNKTELFQKHFNDLVSDIDQVNNTLHSRFTNISNVYIE